MAKRPDISWLRKLPPGRVKGADDLLQGSATSPSPSIRGKAKSTNTEEKATLGLLIHGICQEHQLEYKTDYKFHNSRRWKFDYAIPALKISVEYEGLQSEKSGHTTLVGYTRNCDKYNAAVLDGWHLLRYTAKNHGNVAVELSALIKILKQQQ